MKIIQSTRSRIIFSISAVCLFFLALIWLSYLRQSSFDKQDTIRSAVEKNSNLALVLEQFTTQTIRNADAVLQLVRREYDREGDSLDLKKLFGQTTSNLDIIEDISIIGPDGHLKMASTTYPRQPLPDYSDRPYYIFHAQNQKDSLLISKPEVVKTIGKALIIISRRLNDRQGRFAGVVALHVQPSAFTSFYAQARLLPHDIISLIAPDGITYARRTGTIGSSGEDISKSPLFVHVAQNSDSFYFAKDAIRHVPTWFSYRKLSGYPIIATVGSSLEDILADYRDRQSRYIVPRIMMSVLIMLFSFLVALFFLHRRELLERLIIEEERHQRLLTEHVIAAQEREREWIGRELHDNVSQVLTTVKLYLEMASKKQGDPLIPRSMQLINSSITEIRNLSHQLSAPTLGTRSLIDSINALIETVGYSSNLVFEFDHSGYHGRVAMNQKLALYRILQEQLNNIVKHAVATRVRIQLSRTGDSILLSIYDNGKGFDTNTKKNGMGLNNMMSRAKVFGGTVLIESSPGTGCTVVVTVPVLAEQH